MKRILLAVALLFSTSAFAGTYGTCDISNSGLPDAVVQKLKADCETLRLEQISKEALEKAAAKNAPIITPERITGWAQVAEGFANAMGAAAKQLNISVNEFITTPAGLITVGVILWKVIGASVLKLIAMYLVFRLVLAIIRGIWKIGTKEVSSKFMWWSWTSNKPVYSTWADATEMMCGFSFLLIVVGLVLETVLLINLV